jgi:hypothetical protein
MYVNYGLWKYIIHIRHYACYELDTCYELVMYVQISNMVKVLVDHSLWIILCFGHSMFLFMILNCIKLL